MSRRAARLDANHAEIVKALEAAGALVEDMSGAANGFPDLVIYHRRRYILIEVKDSSKPPSARRLTPAQVRFHSKFPVTVVTSIDEALEAIK